MTSNRRVEQFHPLGQRHWNVQERLDFPKPHDSHDSIASKNGNIHRFTSTQKPSKTHKFMSHVFPGPLKLLIPRNFLSKAPFHLVQYRIFQCHGANDEVAPWNVTRMESQDYRCNMNDESNDLQLLLSGTANKSSIILLKVYTKKHVKKNTDFCCKVDWNFDIKVPTLQTQPEKCERLTTSYSSKRQLVSVPLKGQCSWSSTQRLPDKQTGLHMETSGNFED